MTGMGSLRLAFRLAVRELRGGLTGLRLLAACLFLGVAALAGVGSLTSAIDAALSEQGQALLGGDIAFELSQRTVTDEERVALQSEGTVSEVTRMRAMVARIDGSEAILGEVKAVDGQYPLYGALVLSPGALAPRPGVGDVALAEALADRLNVKTGDRVRIGDTQLRVIGTLVEEPDRVGSGFAFGPTAMISAQSLPATNLIQPGSIYQTLYRVRTPAGVEPEVAIDRINANAPDAGWESNDRSNGSPGTSRFIGRMGQFLSLVGLTALVVAGIGVGNGVASYLDGKRGGIATMKALGATSGTIFLTYLMQVMLVAVAGILAGLAAGAVVPWIVAALAGDALPVPPSLAVYPVPLLVSAAYGVLITFLFALAPLTRARSTPAASLFRGGLGIQSRPGWRILAAMGAVAALISALAIATAREPGFAAMFIGAALAVLALLSGLGVAIVKIAARLPRPRHPLRRLALANLHRPGAQTGRLVVALGLGLSLFALLAVIETNLSGQMASTIPKKAPAFFALDIPSEEIGTFRGIVERQTPGSDINAVPSLRGTVVAVKDVRVSDMKDIPEDAWILRGDRGLTYAADVPQGSRVVEGEWWPRDYAGPALVSMDLRAATALALKVGDSITVSVLGVEIPATIGSLREIDWDSMGLNFGMVFSPNALSGAPHSFLATVSTPDGTTTAQESALNRTFAQAFPSASMIRVKDVISSISDVLGQLSVAVRAAASVAVAAGIAVLIGAIAAARQARVYDAVLLKVLGGTRRQVLAAQAMEYSALALIVSIVAFAVAAAGGYYVVTQVLRLEWAPDWGVVLLTLLAGAVLTLGLGLAGSLPALAARPARALREL